MNEIERKKSEQANNSKSTGQIYIENEDTNEETRSYSITFFKTVRSILINSPPILTKDLELGNFRKGGANDFVFKDFADYMGKSLSC